MIVAIPIAAPSAQGIGIGVVAGHLELAAVALEPVLRDVTEARALAGSAVLLLAGAMAHGGMAADQWVAVTAHADLGGMATGAVATSSETSGRSCPLG